MITIILTCTVYVNYNKLYIYQNDASERIHTYLKSIHQWLNKTNFHIVVVENSGYTFPELDNEKEMYKDRFEVITLNETIEPTHLRNSPSKGESEMFSIYYAFESSTKIRLSSFIIKVTCRFFIPELEEYLIQQDLTNYECLTQHDRNRCEMVGCRPSHFSHMFNIELDYIEGYNGHIEDIWKLRTSNYKNLACKVFDIEPTMRGGVNEEYTTI
jgi:hypothetical protein